MKSLLLGFGLLLGIQNCGSKEQAPTPSPQKEQPKPVGNDTGTDPQKKSDDC